MNRAVFLDRDGVLIEDVHLLTRPDEIFVFPGVPKGLQNLKQAGLRLIVVSNQTVVARGMVKESDVHTIHEYLEKILEEQGGPRLDGFYFCPHHPRATLRQYRVQCQCRKPLPGLILTAACEHDVDLASSFVVGDRVTDIIAGAKAGCRTILVQTGKHDLPPIESSDEIDVNIEPDYTCETFLEAVAWILDRI